MLRIISQNVNPQAIEQTIGGLGGGMMAGRAEKIKEYVMRINHGESQEMVLQGLPKSMILEVEQQLSRFCSFCLQRSPISLMPYLFVEFSKIN